MIVKSFLNSSFDIKITHSTFNCYNIEEILNTNQTSLSISAMGSPAITTPTSVAVSSIGTTLISNMIIKRPPFIKSHFRLTRQVRAADFPEVLTKRTEFTSNTKYAFWILAFIQLPASAILLFLLKKKKDTDILNMEDDETTEHEQSNDIMPFEFTVGYLKKRYAQIPAKQLTFLISGKIYGFFIDKFVYLKQIWNINIHLC